MNEEGLIFVSSITLPFADCSYVIKLQAQEYTHIGERERLVEERLKGDGKMPDVWAQDPYDDRYQLGELKNASDDARFDLFFPDHPLSQVRGFMFRIKSSIQFDEKVSNLEGLKD